MWYICSLHEPRIYLFQPEYNDLFAVASNANPEMEILPGEKLSYSFVPSHSFITFCFNSISSMQNQSELVESSPQ